MMQGKQSVKYEADTITQNKNPLWLNFSSHKFFIYKKKVETC